MCAGIVDVRVCVHMCEHCVPRQPLLPWGVGPFSVRGLHELGGRRVLQESGAMGGDVSVPDGSFSPQENSDVFISTVDTDWKVGPAMGSAPHPGVPTWDSSLRLGKAAGR